MTNSVFSSNYVVTKYYPYDETHKLDRFIDMWLKENILGGYEDLGSGTDLQTMQKDICVQFDIESDAKAFEALKLPPLG
jgi:hypothetical protein